MDFRKHIQTLAKNKKNILEIGPSYNPILSKRCGYHVAVMDHASREALVDKYKVFEVDTSKIEEVDYITTNLETIISTGEKFDLILASHVIEHVTDFVKFFNDCGHLLSDDGEIILIVPDKRHCFDFFRPVTTPGAMVDAHVSHRGLHIGGLFDHYSYFCRSNNQMAWGQLEDISALEFIHTAEMTKKAVDVPLLTGDYADAHEWVFVPSSFAFVIAELRTTGFINVGIEYAHATLGYEFLVTLSNNAPAESRSKSQLLFAVQDEICEGFGELKAVSEVQVYLTEEIIELKQKQVLDIQRLTDVIHQQDVEIKNLYSSTSWRLTKPLRYLRNLVRPN